MYELFDGDDNLNTGRISLPEFDHIKKSYLRDLFTVLEYHHTHPLFVNNEHLVVQILRLAQIPITYPLEQYASIAIDRAPYIANHFNIISERNYGKITRGDFYGVTNYEILISDRSVFSPFEAMENWKDLEPIKVLEHPFCELSLLPPSGVTNSKLRGFVSLCIDIPLLLIQYRGFLLDQQTKILNAEREDSLDETHFVRMYVLPNMMKSSIDITILNRLKNLYYNKEVDDKPHRKLPFAIVDYGDKVDRVLTNVLARIENKSLLYTNVLKQIPTIVSPNMFYRLQMPDLAKTRQVWWALLSTRWSTIMFLLRVCGDEGITRNKDHFAKLKITLKRMHSDNTFKQCLPSEIYNQIVKDIEEVNEM